MTIAHGLIQTARGALTDEDWREAERLLAKAVEAVKDIEEERDQLAGAVEALVKIAVKGPATDMRGVALNELQRQGIDPHAYGGQS